jgi:hypothetical protein
MGEWPGMRGVSPSRSEESSYAGVEKGSLTYVQLEHQQKRRRRKSKQIFEEIIPVCLQNLVKTVNPQI